MTDEKGVSFFEQRDVVYGAALSNFYSDIQFITRKNTNSI